MSNERDVTNRSSVQEGMMVFIVTDGGERVRGYVQSVKTKKKCSHGVRVILTNGKEGHIESFVTEDMLKKDNFVYWNKFFYRPEIYAIWDEEKNQFFTFLHTNKYTGVKEETILLFTEVDKLKQAISNNHMSGKRYKPKRISMKKGVAKNFAGMKVDYFRVDMEKKVSYEKIQELEYLFRKVMK